MQLLRDKRKSKVYMLYGQTYQIKSGGNCCICKKRTKYWLDNANDYFCLNKLCFEIRHLISRLNSLTYRFEEFIKNLGNIERLGD